jgi:hypothetical protein
MVRKLYKSLVQVGLADRNASYALAIGLTKVVRPSYHKLCARQARFSLDGNLIGKDFKS